MRDCSRSVAGLSLPNAVLPITVEKTERSLRAGPDQVPAVFPGGEGDAFAGVAEGAHPSEWM
jgi:hypothetical protein